MEQRQVVADFSGGSITSDAGLVLVSQLDKQYQITQRLSGLVVTPESYSFPLRDDTEVIEYKIMWSTPA